MNGDYTYSELMSMQEQALARVRDMQRRAALAAEDADKNLARSGIHREPPPISPPMPVPIPKPENPPKRTALPVDYLHTPGQQTALPELSEPVRVSEEPPQSKPKQALPKENARPASFLDGDRALILALVLFLSQEGADNMLIFALMYIMG
ncbi:MAG: hypothetical protein GX851_07970 [Clostridiales bacterium]|nr:hypothetical protein [Clostridiales bacterium]